MTPGYRRFHYAAVATETFIAASRVATPPDSYLAMDAELKALREDIFAKGYRFVGFSPDGATSLFEKPIRQYPRAPQTDPKPATDLASDARGAGAHLLLQGEPQNRPDRARPRA
jgi:hypothetical protein